MSKEWVVRFIFGKLVASTYIEEMDFTRRLVPNIEFHSVHSLRIVNQKINIALQELRVGTTSSNMLPLPADAWTTNIDSKGQARRRKVAPQTFKTSLGRITQFSFTVVLNLIRCFFLKKHGVVFLKWTNHRRFLVRSEHRHTDPLFLHYVA